MCEVEVYSMDTIYARVICLMSTRKLQMEDVLRHELVPVPTAVFLETDDIRPARNKSELKKALQVESGSRNNKVEAVFIDGNAMACYWSEKGTFMSRSMT